MFFFFLVNKMFSKITLFSLSAYSVCPLVEGLRNMVDKVFHLKFFSFDLTRFLDEVDGAGEAGLGSAGGINK